MSAIEVVLAGAGQRGRYVYGAHARRFPESFRVVALIEPNDTRRRLLGDDLDLPASRRFRSGGECLASGVDGDAWIVATPDRDHAATATLAIEAGRHVLVEKPLAASAAEAVALVQAASRAGVILAVSHVLRYTPFFRALHEVIRSGRLGEIVTVEHRENVAAWHMAHSFVRGNWGNVAAATPMIVQKCCHDFDILSWNLTAPVMRLTSVGSLFHFHRDNAPPGATARCTDGCPVENCPFDARALYLDERRRGWPVHVITDDLSAAGRREALRNGRYGRCVYQVGSDAVDHQVVTMELAGGASAVLVMHGHSHAEARTMRYDGTRATLRGVFGSHQELELIDHATGKAEQVPVPISTGGHGGGDPGLITAFCDAVRGDPSGLTPAADALEGHLLAFAAEEARLGGTSIEMDAFRRTATGEAP